MNDDKLSHESENVHSNRGVHSSGDVNTGGGDFIGRDQVIHGYSSQQVSELLEQIRKKFQPKPFDGRSPYIGLDPFQEKDADRFFGRDKLIGELLKSLTTSHFVMITGPSGSGKSSVIQAGLIPTLKRGIIQGSDRWLYATLRPGREPLASLGRAMAGLVGQSSVVKEFQEQGLENYSLLADWAEIALGDHPNNRILLVIDQFEEIFTQLSDKDEPMRSAFIRQLENAYSVESHSTIFMLAMRSDFIGQCAAYSELNDLINQQFLFQVGAMSRDELLSAIARPALEVGLRIDPDLVAQVLSDMRDQSGSLPLMQFAMADLFHAEQEAGGVLALTLERYMALGGLSHALERHADTAFARLSQAEQELARRVFEGLVQPGLGTVDTARTARFNELEIQGSSPQEVNSVIHKLADSRLVTTDESHDDEPTVRLIHEQLLEAWPWLRRLVDENREVISLQNDIQQDAKLWEDKGYDKSYLYTGARLETARERLEEEKIHLTETAASFLEAGVQRKLAEEKEKEERRRRELEAAQKLAEERRQKLEAAEKLAKEQQARADEQAEATTRMRRRALIIAGVGMVAVVLTILAGIFYFRAQNNEATARARELVAYTSNLLNHQKQDLAILLSIEAYRIRDLPQTRQALYNSWGYDPQISRFLSGHSSPVDSLAWSKDGRLASGSIDGTIIIWDLESGQPDVILEGHSDGVLSVAWSEGGHLASGSRDDTVILWDLASRVPKLTLQSHSGNVHSVAWSDDGQLASGSSDNTVIVWDLESGEPEMTLEGHADNVWSVSWSPGGRLVSGSRDGTVIVWDLDTEGQEMILEGHSDDVRSVAWSPDGHLASGGDNKTINLWDLESGKSKMTLEGHSDWVRSVVWSLDGQLASGSRDGKVILWDLEIAHPKTILEGHSDYVRSVVWSPDGQLASASADGTIIIWDLESGQPDVIHDSSSISVNSIAWWPDGYLASGSSDDTIIIWDLESGQSELTLEGHTDGITSMDWSPDGHLASGSKDNTVILWNLESGEPKITLEGHFDDVTSVAWSQTGRLASGADDTIVIVWDLDSGQPEMTLEGHYVYVSSVAWSPDGRLASGSWDNNVIVWDLGSGQPEMILEGHSEYVYRVAWSPDGQLASGSIDDTIIIWDLETGEPEVILEGQLMRGSWSPDERLVIGSPNGTVIVWGSGSRRPELTLDRNFGDVIRVAWSQDGHLATGSSDGTVVIWNPESGQAEVVLERQSNGSFNLAWLPNGQLASISGDTTILIWQVNPEVWISQACQRTGRNLTQAEWDIYFPGETYRKTCDQWPLESKQQ